jgi:hypothetical protein
MLFFLNREQKDNCFPQRAGTSFFVFEIVDFGSRQHADILTVAMKVLVLETQDLVNSTSFIKNKEALCAFTFFYMHHELGLVKRTFILTRWQ